MTFYNIISAFLFIGAFRQLIFLFDTPMMWTAATIAVLVVNDALFTSQLLEVEGAPKYRVGMKIIDVVCFCLVSLALISLAPLENPFQVKPAQALVNILDPPWVTWLLLSLYWCLLLTWNVLAGVYKTKESKVGWKPWLKCLSAFVVLPFIAMTLALAFAESPESVPTLLRIVAFLLLTIYAMIIKPVFWEAPPPILHRPAPNP